MTVEIERLDDPGFTKLFTTFTDTAWRLETLPAYDIGYEQAAFDRFLAQTPDRSSMDDWVEGTVRPAVAEDRQVGRVHVIERTTDEAGNLALSDYLRFELDCYTVSLAAGEEIRIAWTEPGKWPKGVWTKGYDFWLFDEDTDHGLLAEMHYDDGGAFRKAAITDNTEHVRRAAECKRAALAASKRFYP